MENNTTQCTTVVLVEDHDLTRIGLKAALQRQPNTKILGDAENGIKGLQLLRMFHPAVAVIDIGLPDIDGIELIRQFRSESVHADQPAAKTKILILTMHDNEDAVLAAFAAGADSYCIKDIDTEQLINAINITAAGDNWIDPSIASVILKQARVDNGMGNGMGTASIVEIDAIDAESENLLQSSPLTVRELDVLRLIVEGCSNETIGKRLFLTVGTVKTHVRNILNKMCVDDRTQAAVKALRAGLVK
jgi:two-component system, NarL family, response regulator LiaR